MSMEAPGQGDMAVALHSRNSQICFGGLFATTSGSGEGWVPSRDARWRGAELGGSARSLTRRVAAQNWRSAALGFKKCLIENRGPPEEIPDLAKHSSYGFSPAKHSSYGLSPNEEPPEKVVYLCFPFETTMQAIKDTPKGSYVGMSLPGDPFRWTSFTLGL